MPQRADPSQEGGQVVRIDWAMLILNPLEPWPGSLRPPAISKAGESTLGQGSTYPSTGGAPKMKINVIHRLTDD